MASSYARRPGREVEAVQLVALASGGAQWLTTQAMTARELLANALALSESDRVKLARRRPRRPRPLR